MSGTWVTVSAASVNEAVLVVINDYTFTAASVDQTPVEGSVHGWTAAPDVPSPEQE